MQLLGSVPEEALQAIFLDWIFLSLHVDYLVIYR